VRINIYRIRPYIVLIQSFSILTTKQTFKVSYVRSYVLLWSSPTYSIIILLFYSWTQSKAALRTINFQCENDVINEHKLFSFSPEGYICIVPTICHTFLSCNMDYWWFFSINWLVWIDLVLYSSTISLLTMWQLKKLLLVFSWQT
jgi:hypothetical protein